MAPALCPALPFRRRRPVERALVRPGNDATPHAGGDADGVCQRRGRGFRRDVSLPLGNARLADGQASDDSWPWIASRPRRLAETRQRLLAIRRHRGPHVISAHIGPCQRHGLARLHQLAAGRHSARANKVVLDRRRREFDVPGACLHHENARHRGILGHIQQEIPHLLLRHTV